MIRNAVAEDIEQIAPFFREIVAVGESYTYPEGMSDDEIARAWLLPPPWRVLVAVDDDGAILGTAKFGPNHPGRGSHIANASFMVDPAARGRGVGRLLGEEVLRLAREAGYLAMQFNAVVETNTAAVKLWQSLGFEILATVPEAFDSKIHGLVGLHIMFRKL